MAYKTMMERIAEAQKKGTYEGMMLAQGKNIRWFNDEYYETHSAAEMSKEMNQEEWEHNQDKITRVRVREGKQIEAANKKGLDDRLSFIENKRAWGIKKCNDYQKSIPAFARVPEGKIIQDIKNIIGQPWNPLDNDWQKALENYVGAVEKGETPMVSIGEK